MTGGAVVIGSSVAGVRTAQALRSEGYRGGLHLIGDDPDEPYDKPPLSKGLLTGAQQDDAACLLTRDQAAAVGIELVLGRRATALDTDRRLVALDDDSHVEYDQLVIATGARARPSPWSALGVHVLRSMQDLRALREDLHRGGHVVIVGGGFIGAEVASSARTLGLEVTIVDPLEVPMSRVLSAEISEHFLDLHRRNGVVTRLGTGVGAIAEAQGRRLEVTLDDGSVLEADTVVVGIGSLPNDDWLRQSALLVEDGVVCDEYGRAGVPDVYAVGDVARWLDPALHVPVRVEHWTNAVEQARVVAHNIVHPDEPLAHHGAHYVWTDQYDWKIQVAGRTADSRQLAMVGNPRVENRFVALYTQDDVLLSGAVSVNWPQASVICRRALAAGEQLAAVRDKLEAALAKRRLAGTSS